MCEVRSSTNEHASRCIKRSASELSSTKRFFARSISYRKLQGSLRLSLAKAPMKLDAEEAL